MNKYRVSFAEFLTSIPARNTDVHLMKRIASPPLRMNKNAMVTTSTTTLVAVGPGSWTPNNDKVWPEIPVAVIAPNMPIRPTATTSSPLSANLARTRTPKKVFSLGVSKDQEMRAILARDWKLPSRGLGESELLVTVRSINP